MSALISTSPFNPRSLKFPQFTVFRGSSHSQLRYRSFNSSANRNDVIGEKTAEDETLGEDKEVEIQNTKAAAGSSVENDLKKVKVWNPEGRNGLFSKFDQ